jgi:hypothetical protein
MILLFSVYFKSCYTRGKPEKLSYIACNNIAEKMNLKIYPAKTYQQNDKQACHCRKYMGKPPKAGPQFQDIPVMPENRIAQPRFPLAQAAP